MRTMYKILLVATVTLVVTSPVKLMSHKREDVISDSCYKGPLDEFLKSQCVGGYAYRCNNTGLNKIPTSFPKQNASSRMCLLDLSGNNLRRIHNNSFLKITDIMWLYLSENRIDRIDSNAFANLTNLVFLNLTSNLLYNPNSFGKDVFKPLSNLLYLNLKNNSITSYDGLQTLFQPLKKLKSLFISGCYNCTFGKGFENLTKLRNLSLSGTGPNLCNISVLLNSTFNYLPQVRNLYISSCNVSKVGTLALQPLRNIEYLDISYNENLHFDGMKSVLEGLINSTISVLNLNHIYELFEMGTSLKVNYIAPIMYLRNLTKLHLDLNKIEVIEEAVFRVFPNSLKYITIAGNRLTYGKYVEHLVDMEYVVHLDISRQNLNFDPFMHEHYERQEEFKNKLSYDKAMLSPVLTYNLVPNIACSDCMDHCRREGLTCVCLPPKLKMLKWTMSFLRFHVRFFRICPPLELRKLDVRFNLILEWTGPVYGLEMLTELNLAENYCKNMSSDFFDTLFCLRKLNVSGNFLGSILHPSNENAGKHFKNLTNLENIDLSENRITALAFDVFQNLKKIKYLNVSGNMITQWNSSLQSDRLELLDISGNRLDSLPEPLRNYLDNLAQQAQDNQHITVNLGNNPIQANCENRPFLRWLSSTIVNFQFYDDDEFLTNDGQNVKWNDRSGIVDLVKRLDRDCFPISTVVVSVCIFILSISISILVYRYRWKIRHWYYSKRKRHRHQGYDRMFERDAFISYAKSESIFIKHKLVPALERELYDLKLWIVDRDSLAGASVAENLTHAINNCKKSVLFLSNNYFRENWCNYEMNMARIESIESNRKLLILVRYENISAKDIPLDYLRLLKSEQSLEYPQHPQDVETFWNSLAEAIQQE